MIQVRVVTVCLFLLLSSVVSPATENYIMYHKEILKCEQQFLYFGSIKKGISEYKIVFKKYSKPFAKDCFIALQLACMTGDTQDVEYFSRLAFRRGVSWTGAMYSPIVRKMFDANKFFNKKIEAIYAIEHTRFSGSLNSEARKAVMYMAHKDDSVKWSLDGLKGEEYKKKNKTYIDLLDSNTMNVVRLTAKYGFLGCNKIGFGDFLVKNHEEMYPYICFLLVPLIDQLYYHHACCYFMHPERLREALIDGDITPATYASIYEWAFLDLKEKRPETALCHPIAEQTEYYNICPVLKFWQKNTDSVFVNKCRFAIGLASANHFAKRKEFEKETGVKLLFGHFEID